MPQEDLGKAMLGAAAWIGVAVLALVAIARWDPFWGFFPVLAAVVAAWAVGEWVVATGDDERTEGSR